MTLPNLLTILRFLLIPVFVGALLYYNKSFRLGHPAEIYWVIALASFIAASVSDALDGFIARRFHMRSHLGAIMDPLADKALLVSALITLSWIETDLAELPLWFVVLILGRDLLLVMGVIGMQVYVRHVKIKPHWSGKVSTALQMLIISMVLLKFGEKWVDPVIYTAGGVTLVSVVVYLREGIRTAAHSGIDAPGRP